MSTILVGSFPLGAINVGLSGAIAATVPLLSQVDLMLAGSFGLGALLADLSAQLSAALAAQAQITVIDPIAAIKNQLQAILSVQAGLAAALSLSLPPFGISASVSVSAALAVKVGGIQALIAAVLQIKLPLVNLLAQIQAALSAGPFVLLSVGFAAPSTLASSVTEYGALVGGGIGGILPGDQVYGVIILTKSPSASASLSAILLTS